MDKLLRSNVSRLLKKLSEHAEIYAPTMEDGVCVLSKLVNNYDDWTLDYVRTTNSVKDIFFPQNEEIMRYKNANNDLNIEPPKPFKERVAFGVRPCDAAAMLLLDNVFLEGEFYDSYYKERREKGALITIACEKPDQYCFCTSFHSSPGATEGSDIVLYPADDYFLVVAVTDKGKKLIKANAEIFENATEKSGIVENYKSMKTPIGNNCSPGELNEKLKNEFDNPYWKKIARRCLGCGNCTFVCPTCHCFAVCDVARGCDGKRTRTWDSCKFQDFFLMAGDHNPRPTQVERTRQRFMHKLNYFKEKYDKYQCVGCGRCVEKCPVGVHIADVITHMKEEL
ncbi:MAG: hypothetical protein COA82_05440 [Alkaliphilus sp.]|nr:MAG: hypothetical protein COA82_05440 [Alkaliphilus sp.]